LHLVVRQDGLSAADSTAPPTESAHDISFKRSVCQHGQCGASGAYGRPDARPSTKRTDDAFSHFLHSHCLITRERRAAFIRFLIPASPLLPLLLDSIMTAALESFIHTALTPKLTLCQGRPLAGALDVVDSSTCAVWGALHPKTVRLAPHHSATVWPPPDAHPQPISSLRPGGGRASSIRDASTRGADVFHLAAPAVSSSGPPREQAKVRLHHQEFT
jgi:hypothetical protein